MSTLTKRLILSLMAISFLMGVGAYGFNAKVFAHDLEHDRLLLPVEHGHAQQFDADGNPGPTPLDEAEHQLAHTAGHFQLFSGSFFSGWIFEPLAAMLLISLSLLPFFSTIVEPLFRPPQVQPRK